MLSWEPDINSLASKSAALSPSNQFQHVGVHFFPGIGAQRDEIEGSHEAGVAFVVEEVDEVHVGGVLKGRGYETRTVINEDHGG